MFGGETDVIIFRRLVIILFVDVTCLFVSSSPVFEWSVFTFFPKTFFHCGINFLKKEEAKQVQLLAFWNRIN